MIDFTIKIYTLLLDELKSRGYGFQSVVDWCLKPQSRIVMLRHDVDLRNWAALRLAKLEHSMGINSTYYFRMTKQSYDRGIIKEIAGLGHEIGYHYEDLTSADGDQERAITAFQNNLAKLRELYPVQTICMHGRSGSQYDNRDLWKKYDYRDFGILCEPYVDLDYKRVLYLSDTGRRWNGFKVSLRDRVDSGYDFDFSTTKDVIGNITKLPDQILITAHPEQWTDNLPEWLFVKLFAFAHTFYKVHYRNKKTSRLAKK